MAAPPPYQKSAYGVPQQISSRSSQLLQAIKNYRPGRTIRLKSERPNNPPQATRICLFGGPGVGKSALINSFLYVTDDDSMWAHMAPEAFQGDGASFTMNKTAFGLTEHLAVCDNRGLQDFSGRYMAEVGQQLAGRRGDGAVVWDRGFLGQMAENLRRAFKNKEELKIHCAVLVINSKILIPKPYEMKEIVRVIVDMTGQPPIVIMTHKDSSAKGKDEFKRDLLDNLRIQHVFEIENYTKDDHDFDARKHEEILEALYQCTIVADKMMKHAEEQGLCSIL